MKAFQECLDKQVQKLSEARNISDRHAYFEIMMKARKDHNLDAKIARFGEDNVLNQALICEKVLDSRVSEYASGNSIPYEKAYETVMRGPLTDWKTKGQ